MCDSGWPKAYLCKDVYLSISVLCGVNIWSLAVSKPCPRAPSHGLFPSPVTYDLLIKKKKKSTHKNKEAKEPNWKTYLLWGSFFTQRRKQNQCSKKATDFLCSISHVNHDQLARVVFFFFFSERERERNKANKNEKKATEAATVATQVCWSGWSPDIPVARVRWRKPVPNNLRPFISHEGDS